MLAGPSVVSALWRVARSLPLFVIHLKLGAISPALRLLLARKDALLAAAQLLMRNQAFEQKLCCGNRRSR